MNRKSSEELTIHKSAIFPDDQCISQQYISGEDIKDYPIQINGEDNELSYMMKGVIFFLRSKSTYQ